MHGNWDIQLLSMTLPIQHMATLDMSVDTGAEVSVTLESRHRKVGSPSLSRPDRTLKGPSNQ